MSRSFLEGQNKLDIFLFGVLLRLAGRVLCLVTIDEPAFNAEDCTSIAVNGTCNCTYNDFETALIICADIQGTARISITVTRDKDVDILCEGRIGLGYNFTHPQIPRQLLTRLPLLVGVSKVNFLNIHYCLPFAEILERLALKQSYGIQLNGLEFIPLLELRHLGLTLGQTYAVTTVELLAQELTHLHEPESMALFAQMPAQAIIREQQLDATLFNAFPQLRSVTIAMQFTELPAALFKPVAQTLTEVYLIGALRAFPCETLSVLRDLRQLNMAGNPLGARLRRDDFSRLGALRELMLGRCEITMLPPHIFAPLTSLEELSLNRNKLRALPYALLATQGRLQLLDLSENQLVELPPQLFAKTIALRELHLSGNRLRQLYAHLLPPRTALMKLYLDENELRAIEVGAFAHAQQLRLLDLSVNQLSWQSSAVSCAILAGLRQLDMLVLRNNSVSAICVELTSHNHSTRALNLIDLRNNNLTHVNAQLLRAFNNSKTLQHVYLAGNPLVCDCNAQHLHAFVRANHLRFVELENIICKTPEISTPLFKLSYRDFCPFEVGVKESLVFTFTSVSALGLLLILSAVIYYKYKLALKIWLYARGWCLRCISEAELDRERKYDAFISYTHEDGQFVERELLPGLEHGSPAFKICIHVRDWLVGAFIAEQIIASIEQSRRTIIVLSQHFIRSSWARMEFRMAHQCALNEGRSRIILVIYGHINEEELLDLELRAYLKMNTYLKWGEPWFWQKLRYAMPHRRCSAQREEVHVAPLSVDVPMQTLKARRV